MLVDLVLDTNLLMHADDKRQSHREDAKRLLDQLRDGTTALCVDDGFDLDESKNKSLIGGEYFERLTATNTATAIIAHLFASNRVEFVSRTTPQAVKKCIEQCVRKKRDRTFLAVAHNSKEQVLGSHDYEDMQSKKRRHIKSSTGVKILESAQVRALL
jgi:predicted nucleic acid-binding protein